MSYARLVEYALLLGALSRSHVVLADSALLVESVFDSLLADDVVDDLFLRVHLAVVVWFGKRFVSAQAQRDGLEAEACGEHFGMFVYVCIRV